MNASVSGDQAVVGDPRSCLTGSRRRSRFDNWTFDVRTPSPAASGQTFTELVALRSWTVKTSVTPELQPQRARHSADSRLDRRTQRPKQPSPRDLPVPLRRRDRNPQHVSSLLSPTKKRSSTPCACRSDVCRNSSRATSSSSSSSFAGATA